MEAGLRDGDDGRELYGKLGKLRGGRQFTAILLMAAFWRQTGKRFWMKQWEEYLSLRVH